ncbi:hypothetical protein GCM10009665_15870 [Kitasatospora nipponensis]|uniref:Uncharacterized protein n=1 Tax=Kitasatospora nipponensis TaxID=258049 RepID=A0ABN1VWY5_9ACTN
MELKRMVKSADGRVGWGSGSSVARVGDGVHGGSMRSSVPPRQGADQRRRAYGRALYGGWVTLYAAVGAWNVTVTACYRATTDQQLTPAVLEHPGARHSE